jgi:hypothetical protein
MLKDDALVGAITVYRKEVRPLYRQADRTRQELRRQAVIAIVKHAAAQRVAAIAAAADATADVLKVISRSTFDLQTV